VHSSIQTVVAYIHVHLYIMYMTQAGDKILCVCKNTVLNIIPVSLNIFVLHGVMLYQLTFINSNTYMKIYFSMVHSGHSVYMYYLYISQSIFWTLV